MKHARIYNVDQEDMAHILSACPLIIQQVRDTIHAVRNIEGDTEAEHDLFNAGMDALLNTLMEIYVRGHVAGMEAAMAKPTGETIQ